MAYQINVLPSGRQLQAEDGETILAVALCQGIGLPYGCKNGTCGSCKGHVCEGSVVQGNHSPNALTVQETTESHVLFYCVTPATDVTIEVREVHGVGDVPIKEIPCRVASLEKAAPGATIVKLQLPATECTQFLAGQYVEFLLRDDKRRSYSIANPPHDDDPIELHIRHMLGGAFTDYIFSAKEGAPAMKERDILRFEGLLGSLFLCEESNKPIILLASGTGFTPIRVIIEHAQFTGSTRPMTLYRGGRRLQDLYMHAKAEEWARTLPNFTYVPVISNTPPEDVRTGRTGFVHQAVMADHPDLSGHEVYVCGAPVVINSARTKFAVQCGMHPDAFFVDSFTSEVDLRPAG